jgi:acid stress-induced BolA-like protein IbaG/YrbA
MEIEKTRETSWKIQLKNKNENIELTSVEISGEVRLIKLRLLKNGDFINVEMKKEEFFNFLSLISAFKDVVIGDDKISLTDDLTHEDFESHQKINEDEKIYVKIEPQISERELKNNEVKELNPEEWDPW